MPLYLFSVLAAPKWVLKQIKALQRNFLWGASGHNRKWALVKWTTVCTPKHMGGLGLRDPQHSNAIMGAKVWWNWLSKPHSPWARLWTDKYANHRPISELIRLTTADSGSLIWNAAKQHRQLIQEHSFWEVHNGQTARFWTDAWQQRPRLMSCIDPQLQPQETHTTEDLVCQFWEGHLIQGFRQWKSAATYLSHQHVQARRQLEKELSSRKLRFSERPDII